MVPDEDVEDVCKTSVISTIVDVAGNHLVDRL